MFFKGFFVFSEAVDNSTNKIANQKKSAYSCINSQYLSGAKLANFLLFECPHKIQAQTKATRTKSITKK
jgi:hypothetical protein